MTTIKPTQRDREAAEKSALALGGKMTCFDCLDELTNVLTHHAAAACAIERAAIVEWLRDQSQGRLQSAVFLAAAIEAGEHISDNAEAIARGENSA
jgi:hypothetical protein